MKKSAIKMVLGLFVLLFMLSPAAWAMSTNEDYQVEEDVQNTPYAPLDDGATEGQLWDFAEAWQLAAAENGVVTLQQDVLVAAEDAPDGIFVQVPEDGRVLLDLNGYRLVGEDMPCLIYVGARGKLTVTDGGQSGSQIIGVVGVDDSADDPDEWGQLELLGEVEVIDPSVMMSADHSHALKVGNDCAKDTFTTPIAFKAFPSLSSTEQQYIESTQVNVHILKTGNYYLNRNVTIGHPIYIPQNQEVNICLNNYSLKYTGADTLPVIYVDFGSTLHICDCGSNGAISGGSNSGIYSYGPTYLHSGNISGNSGQQGAGVKIDANYTFNMYGGKISNNTARGGSGPSGGGVAVRSYAKFNMYGGEISGNTVEGVAGFSYGGGIHVTFEGSLNIEGGTISNNTITNGYGGGIGISKVTQNRIPPITIKKVTMENNSAGGSGGAIYAYSDLSMSITISDSQICNNTSASDGGGIYFLNNRSGSSSLTIENSEIKSNTTSSDGGGIYYSVNYGGLTIKNSQVANNTSTGSGGGLYVFNGTANLEGDTLVKGNSAQKSGGGIYLRDSGGNVRISDSVQITNNVTRVPENGGGGIYAANSFWLKNAVAPKIKRLR